MFHVETNWREETREFLRHALEPTATDRNEPFPICPLRHPVLLDGDDFRLAQRCQQGQHHHPLNGRRAQLIDPIQFPRLGDAGALRADGEIERKKAILVKVLIGDGIIQ